MCIYIYTNSMTEIENITEKEKGGDPLFSPDAQPTPGGHVPSLAASLISQNGEAPNLNNLDSICTYI